MSLFDVLKYQVSERPTAAEFEALPDSVFNQVVVPALQRTPTMKLTRSTAATVVYIMIRQPANHATAKQILLDIRKALEEL